MMKYIPTDKSRKLTSQLAFGMPEPKQAALGVTQFERFCSEQFPI